MIHHDTPHELRRTFLLECGAALHQFGTPTHRMETALASLAMRLGLTAQVLCTPTSMIVAFGPMHDQQVSLLRLEPGAIHLEKLSAVDAVVTEVINARLRVPEGLERLREIIAAPLRFGPGAIALATCSSAGAISVFFGATLTEAGASAAAGMLVGGVLFVGQRLPRTAPLIEPVAATLSALFTVLIACLVPIRPNLVLIASLIILVPGFSLTLAIREIAARHLIAGSARMFGAALVFLQLGFGVLLTYHLAQVLPVQHAAPAAPMGFLASALALCVSITSFGVFFSVRPAHMGWVFLGCLLAHLGVTLPQAALGPQISGFIGALLIGLASNLFARLTGRPASIMMIPGVILLVPGAVGLRSLSAMAGRDVVGGVETGFGVLMIATAIVAGLLIADTLVPSRRSL